MPAHHLQTGASGETAARRYLEAHGYEFVQANVRNRYGETDLVMRRDHTLVFVEVKTRRSSRAGLPEESVTAVRLARLARAAAAYCVEHDHHEDWRIDVIAIGPDRQVRHLQNVTY